MLKCSLCKKESEVVYGFVLYRYGGNYFTTKVNGLEYICKDCLETGLSYALTKFGVYEVNDEGDNETPKRKRPRSKKNKGKEE
jgi:hypothetical protein